jgi:cobalt-zinc-cadmium efflux system membrane fusion protein
MNRISIVLSCLLVAASACQHSGSSSSTGEEKEDTCAVSPALKSLMKLSALQMSPVHGELELTGSISYDQDHLFRYQSLASGVVRQVHFKLGDYVQKGQVLAEIRTTELSGQSADLRKAEATQALAERQLSATQRLHDDGIASDKELLEAKNDAQSALLEINRLKDVLAIQGGSVEKGVMVIKAPLSGYIVEKKITSGYQMDAGEDNLFVLSDLKKVWVMANVYAAQLGLVKAGLPVEITTTAYPGRVFNGKISRLSNIFDPEEKVMKAVIELDNANLALKPDMMVSVNVHLNEKEQALAVPLNAVIFDDDTYHVVRYKSNCDVQDVTIEPLSHDKEYYYVSSPALQAGDSIISQNHLLIYNRLKGR